MFFCKSNEGKWKLATPLPEACHHHAGKWMHSHTIGILCISFRMFQSWKYACIIIMEIFRENDKIFTMWDHVIVNIKANIRHFVLCKLTILPHLSCSIYLLIWLFGWVAKGNCQRNHLLQFCLGKATIWPRWLD